MLDSPEPTRSMFHVSATRRLFAVAAISATLTLAACGGGDNAANQGADASLERGKAHYARICATCHGADATGMPALGKSLIANAFTKSQSDMEMLAFLKTGRSAGDPLNETGVDMPPKGGDPTMTEDDLKDIVVFLRTL